MAAVALVFPSVSPVTRSADTACEPRETINGGRSDAELALRLAYLAEMHELGILDDREYEDEHETALHEHSLFA